MAMTPEHRRKLLASTKPAATALLEDLDYIEEISHRQTQSRGELRRLSAVLRRLLVDRNIVEVAAPRIGRLRFRTPDNEALYRDEAQNPYLFCLSGGGADVFGTKFRAAMIPPHPVPEFDPQRFVDYRLDRFLSQKVLCLERHWISREAAIKYTANIAGGVHSGTPRDYDDAILDHIRRYVRLSVEDGRHTMTLDLHRLDPSSDMFNYRPDTIDPILWEILATAYFVNASPDTSSLTNLLRSEFAIK
jgi:hypothetical protein